VGPALCHSAVWLSACPCHHRQGLPTYAGGRVPVPESAVAFTVKLPGRLAEAVRAHARMSGRTISAVVAHAPEEFLARGNWERRRR
jgi:hypothetical protein